MKGWPWCLVSKGSTTSWLRVILTYLLTINLFLAARHFDIFAGLLAEDRPVPTQVSARIQRWSLLLAAYPYHLHYRSGSKMQNADALSRLPLPEAPLRTNVPPENISSLEVCERSLVSAVAIARWTRQDSTLSAVMLALDGGWPNSIDAELKPFANRKLELSKQDGVLFWGSRVVVPPKGQSAILDELHEGHPGVSRMKALARSYVWWPGIDSAIEQLVRGCTVCQRGRHLPPPASTPPMGMAGATMDPLARRLCWTSGGQNVLLIVVDAHSKWIEVFLSSSSISQYHH